MRQANSSFPERRQPGVLFPSLGPRPARWRLISPAVGAATPIGPEPAVPCRCVSTAEMRRQEPSTAPLLIGPLLGAIEMGRHGVPSRQPAHVGRVPGAPRGVPQRTHRGDGANPLLPSPRLCLFCTRCLVQRFSPSWFWTSTPGRPLFSTSRHSFSRFSVLEPLRSLGHSLARSPPSLGRVYVYAPTCPVRAISKPPTRSLIALRDPESHDGRKSVKLSRPGD